MTLELSHPRGSWAAPTSAPLLSLSSQRRRVICLPSSPPTSVRAQEKSPSSFLGSWFSGRSPWSRLPHPIRPDRPKMGCQGFPRGDFEEGCSDAYLHWRALLYCRGHSHPNPMGYSLPVDLTVLPGCPPPPPVHQGLGHTGCALRRHPRAPTSGLPRWTHPGENGICHAHSTGQPLFFIMMKKICTSYGSPFTLNPLPSLNPTLGVPWAAPSLF